MTIGVLTFWWSQDNYGQLLQAYALQMYLRSLGHHVLLLNYKEGYGGWWIDLKKMICRLRFYENPFVKNHKFNDFRKHYFILSKRILNSNIEKITKDIDVFICGSDQVWAKSFAMCETAKNWFLNFVPSEKKKIAYAASFGRDDASPEAIKFISKYIGSFFKIGVRENSGKLICEKAGRKDACVVCDPTLLLSRADYLSLVPHKNVKCTRYALAYLISWPTEFPLLKIKQMLLNRQIDLRVVRVKSNMMKWSLKWPQEEFLTIEEWLAAYSQAEYVFTNSYHGTVFSIIMQRKFLVFPLSGSTASMNTRIKTLLDACGLSSRFYDPSTDIEAQINKEIDWTLVERMMNNFICQSKEFIETALT